MIIWLASYPRSGNTLLRTVFKQTMGLGSYSDENMLPSVGHTELSKKSYGNLEYEGSWDSFYNHASMSKDIFLVKTHLPPRDNQPVISVVRDGRSATQSYAAYHKDYIKTSKDPSTILELMIGDDYYGDWTSHFSSWNYRPEGSTLLVRFEELVNPKSILLQKLGRFVNFNEEIMPFNNPIEMLNLENPNFFRSGITEWGGGEWSDKLKYFFIALHGDLLIQLGYLSIAEREYAVNKLHPVECKLMKLANKGFVERNVMCCDAQAKEKVIQHLLQEKKETTLNNKPSENFLSHVFSLNRNRKR